MEEEQGREVEWESARCSLACLSSTKTKTKHEYPTSTCRHIANPRTPGTLEHQFDHLGFSRVFVFWIYQNDIWSCRISTQSACNTPLCCTAIAPRCAAVVYLLQTAYVTDQRLNIGYWLLLGSMVAILNTTPRWRWHSQTCCIRLSYWITQ